MPRVTSPCASESTLPCSLVMSAALTAVTAYVHGMLPVGLVLLEALNAVIGFGVVTILFAMIYKVLPDVKVAWRDVWAGALMTAALFALGKWALGLYLGRAAVGSAFGAAGSLVAVLVWVYYAAQILFYGAELTQVYAKRHGSHAAWPAAAASPGASMPPAERPSAQRRTPARGTVPPLAALAAALLAWLWPIGRRR